MILLKVHFWLHADWSAVFVYMDQWWDLQDEDSGLARSLSPNWMLDLKSCVSEVILPLDRILKGPQQTPLEGPILFLELT